MKILAAAVVFWMLPTLVFGGCGDCPPKADWTVVEELWWILVDDPSEDVGTLLLDALPVGARIPDDRSTLQQTIVESKGGLIRAIEEKQRWAVQLGLRLAADHHLSIRPGLQLALGVLVTSDPEVVLRELEIAYGATKCGGFLHGFVQYFGTEQEKRDGTEPLLEDLEARLAALASVEEPDLNEVREMCIGLLEVQAQGIRESPFPRMLKRPDFDTVHVKCTDVRRCFVVAKATIGIDGHVASVEILRGGDPVINRAVIDGLNLVAFEPKIEEGRAVEFDYILSVRAHP